MKKKQILLSYAGKPLEKLPAEIRLIVESDPDLAQKFRDQARIASLMQLKTYEQPDPALEGRVLYTVGVRIRNGEHLRASSRLDFFPDWARMVTVVIVMLGLSILTHREMLQNPVDQPNEVETAANINNVMPVMGSNSGLKAMNDPFSPIMVSFDTDTSPSVLTPEFSKELESSYLKLGLDHTNRIDNLNLIPVSYTLFR